MWCCRATEIYQHLHKNGFGVARMTLTHDFWTNHDGSVILQLRKADVNGDMVVELVQTAFDSANLDLPSGQFMCP